MSERTLQEVLENASKAEADGVPVNWRDLCFHTYNVAMNRIRELEAEQSAAKSPELEISVDD